MKVINLFLLYTYNRACCDSGGFAGLKLTIFYQCSLRSCEIPRCEFCEERKKTCLFYLYGICLLHSPILLPSFYDIKSFHFLHFRHIFFSFYPSRNLHSCLSRSSNGSFYTKFGARKLVHTFFHIFFSPYNIFDILKPSETSSHVNNFSLTLSESTIQISFVREIDILKSHCRNN